MKSKLHITSFLAFALTSGLIAGQGNGEQKGNGENQTQSSKGQGYKSQEEMKANQENYSEEEMKANRENYSEEEMKANRENHSEEEMQANREKNGMDKDSQGEMKKGSKEDHEKGEKGKKGKMGDKEGEHNPTDLVNRYELFELSEVEKSTLLYMYEEEKLAYDVYVTLGEQYPESKIFSNISKAEAKHQEAVKALLTKYSIPVSENLEVGTFDDEDLQALYNDLISKATSLEEALKVGQTVEITDMADLESRMENATPDVKAIFEKLYDASAKQLSAFTRTLNGEEIDFEKHDKKEKEAESHKRTGDMKKEGMHIDNGKPMVSIESQKVNRTISANWEMVNIPVTDEVNIADILPKETSGATVFTFDGETQSWNYTRIKYVDGAMVQDKELTIKPLQGFWIKSPQEFNLSTYVPTTVTTGETPPTVPTVQ